MALSIVLNPSHRRLRRPRLGLFVQGQYPSGEGQAASGWSRQLMSNVWQEPIGGNLILLPLCMADEFAWANNFTGEYARLTFADFGLAEGANGWRRGGLNQARLARDEDMAAAAISVSTYGGDRGFYLSYFTFDRGIADGIDLEFGFGSSGSATDPACKLALQFLAGGSVNVNRGGETAGQGSIGSRQKGFQEVLILPLNLREVLIFSLTNREGFIQAFDDVDEADPWPRIVPDVPVWFYRPSGAVDVEIAPLRMATTGRAYSTKQAFAERPTAIAGGGVAEQTEIFARSEGPGTSVAVSVTKLDATPYDPNSEDLGARIKVELVGNGAYSPFVHGAVAGYEPVTAETAAAPIEIRERAMRVYLEVPESPPNVQAGFSALGREIGVDDALWDLARLTNVPVDFLFDELDAPFFRGQSTPTPKRGAPFLRAESLNATFRDEWALLENPRHRDPYPYDYLYLDEALAKVVKHGGGDPNPQIEPTTVRLPLADSPASGDWSEIARGGDVPADHVRRWMETYAATWIYGYFPTSSGRRFRAGSPDGWFGTEPILRLYPTYASAVADGVDPNEAPFRLYQEWEETKLQIEANDVRVSGWDPKLRRRIQSHYFDPISADPTTPWDERPDNWEGLWLPFSLFDRKINSQAAADRACGIIAGRLATRRVVCKFSTEFMRRRVAGGLGMPLWRGDVVELVGRGIYRINTLSAEWMVSEPDDRAWGNPRRRCRTVYTAVKGAGACLGVNSLYASYDGVLGAHDEWDASGRTLARPDSDFLKGRPVAVQSTAQLLLA